MRSRSRSISSRSLTSADAAEVEALHGVPVRLLGRGEGWTREAVCLGTRNATHVDAPYHYNSLVEGRPDGHDRRAATRAVLRPRSRARLHRPAGRRGRRCPGPGRCMGGDRAPDGAGRYCSVAHRLRQVLRRARLHRSWTGGYCRWNAVAGRPWRPCNGIDGWGGTGHCDRRPGTR